MLMSVLLCVAVTVGNGTLHGQTVIAEVPVASYLHKYDYLGKEAGTTKDVLSQARFDLENRFLHCADSWYLEFRADRPSYNRLLELKDIFFESMHEELTRADRANGIEWRGYVRIRSDLYRQYFLGEWSKWKDGSNGVNLYSSPESPQQGLVSLVIENGKLKWDISFYATKPDCKCEDIPSQPENKKDKEFSSEDKQGILYAKNGQYEKAIAECLKALESDKENLQIYYNLGIAYTKVGKLDDAIAIWQKALTINPLLAHLHYSIGLAYKEKGNFELAEASLKKTLEINKFYPNAKNVLEEITSTKHSISK